MSENKNLILIEFDVENVWHDLEEEPANEIFEWGLEVESLFSFAFSKYERKV